ncbi:unnamed protein product [Calypogeia fissa]
MARQRGQARSSNAEGTQGNVRNESDAAKSGDDGVPAAAAPAGQTSGTELRPSRPVTQTSADKGSFGAAVEWLLMVVLMLYVCHLVNVYQSESLPAPLSKEQAGPRGFSEVTAREHIMSLVEFGPHPVGTEALDKALMYVYSELMEIKEEADPYVDFEVDLFEPGPGLNRLVGGLFYGKSLVYANLRHLVVRISPSDFYKSKENAILISSHIDTVITSPGAGDCSSCIAVMLELVRSLSHWAGGFKNSVIFLFNTGEEEGLDGAHSFMTQHPWSPTIRAAIDVEAMGIGGRATLFQAGSDKWLLQQYASVAKYPAAQIGAQDIFHSGLVKSATDFQVYREIGGLSGLDFGFVENGGVYHTKNDKIEFLRQGSLQHIGEDLLALLKKVGLSDELEFLRRNSSGSEKMEMVYFDILGKYMVTYPRSMAKTQYFNLITQGLVLLFSSLYLSGYSAFIEFGLALLTIGFTWISAIIYVLGVAAVLPKMSSFAIPFIAHPWLVVGLFGAPAIFGALLGHAVGRRILMYYLRKKNHTEDHVRWHTERWLFKAGIFQWVTILALGTWVEAGSSYIALFWIIPPTIAYAMFEAQFSPRQTLRALQRGTLWLSMLPGLAMSAVPIIRLTKSVIGMQVGFDRNPGSVASWIGNAFIGFIIAAYVCLLLAYLLPYAHRSGGLVQILSALAIIFFSAVLLVTTQLVPAFTEDVGRGIQAVHVIDTTGPDGLSENPHNYISMFSFTPGKLEKEMSELNDKNFICGQSSIDFVSFKVHYGCMKPVNGDEDLSGSQPVMQTEKDTFDGGQRVTSVRLSSGAAHRWNLAINTTAIEAFKLTTILAKEGEEKVLVPAGTIVGVNGWHNVQFVTDAEGPTDLQLTLFWHSSFQEETSTSKGLETLLLKLRTDVNVVTDELYEVLEKLPTWCVLFGKSTAPYSLVYLADLKAPLSA